jgi:hypothetical protein
MTRHVPTEIRRHWGELVKLGCIVTGSHEGVTLHHCHSGSMAEIGFNRGSRRGEEDRNHWLVIPLHRDLHCWGPEAIDGSKGVQSWEAEYGRQVDLLDEVCRRLNVDVWARAGFERLAA